MGDWMAVKAFLRIAYSNQKFQLYNQYLQLNHKKLSNKGQTAGKVCYLLINLHILT